MTEIHDAARRKYGQGEFEEHHAVRIMIHRSDLCP